ncbi:Polyamine oxidase 7 [Linum grandiflorum]
MYSKEEVDKLDKVFVAMEDYYNKFARMLSRKSDKDADLFTLACQRLYGRVPSSPLEMVMDYYYNDYEDAEPPRATSLKHAYPRTEIEDLHIVTDPRGYDVLVEYLASQILKKGSPVKLKLKKVVREIVYSKNKVWVKTEYGSSYSANYTIVSASLGVLQSDLIKFKPLLPHLENEFLGSNILMVMVTSDESRRVE